MPKSRLIPCRDCDSLVSKSAKTCPHCGVSLRRSFLGRLGKLIVYLFFGLIGLGLVANFIGSEKPAEDTRSTLEIYQEGKASREATELATLRLDFDNANNELLQISFAELLNDPAEIIAGAGIFARFGETLEKASSNSDFSDSEINEFKSRLISAQVEHLPVLRDAYGPAMRNLMWEHDVSVRTIGSGYRTVEFVGGLFAANRNIKKTQQEVSSQLKILRFNKSQYKWFKGEGEYTFYTIDSPSDSDLAKVNGIGHLVPIDLK